MRTVEIERMANTVRLCPGMALNILKIAFWI
jgi:hypothetical protein